MTELIALLSTGKGTWSSVIKLMAQGEWENVYLVTNEFGRDNFNKKENMHFIVIDTKKQIPEIVSGLTEEFKKITGPEVAFNMESGSGKEHMAVLSALLKSGLGIRQVAVTEKGVEEV